MNKLVPIELIENKIYLIRGQKVMLDRDLAFLYGIQTKLLKRAVKRNISRFPDDFMFQLTKDEAEYSRCQFGTLKRGENIKYLPFAFTEHGILMLSSILNSKRAIYVNIQIMRAFVKLRTMLATHKELAAKFAELERKYEGHDHEIKQIFNVIHQLMKPLLKKKKRIGFLTDK